MKRKFHITLLKHEGGVSVSCPDLPGCHSQGTTVDEAVVNISDAIREYVASFGFPKEQCQVRELELALG